MFRLALSPGVHEVPAAIAITALHWPDAQRWKLVPSMQFQVPSSLQSPVCAPVAPPLGVGTATLVVEEAAGTEEEDVGTETGVEVAAADDEIAVLNVVAVATPPVVTKTPPVGVLEDNVSLNLETCIQRRKSLTLQQL